MINFKIGDTILFHQPATKRKVKGIITKVLDSCVELNYEGSFFSYRSMIEKANIIKLLDRLDSPFRMMGNSMA